MTTLAVDIGGTKIEVGLVSAEGAIGERWRAPTGRPEDQEELYGTLEELIGQAMGAGPSLHAVGVGCGGPMSPGGAQVSPLNIPAWRGFALHDRLEATTGLPVYIDNDAKALALGEGWRGAARGSLNFMAIVVSTGVGGGIVLDGRLLDGAAGNAGHIGHVIVEPQGRPCACGGYGCLEAEVSGLSIEAMTGEPAAQAAEVTRRRTGRLVGRAVASVAQLLDLDLATVAGSVALGFGLPFFEEAQAEIERRCGLDFARGTRIVPAGLGPDGPLIGAAAVGLRGLGVRVVGS
ncbi:MAG: N-acetylmannosamine kinase [Acidimicrobiales bacterium]|nr:N-acetylmannosamine kinase [Acidimicrobiales bacterium]